MSVGPPPGSYGYVQQPPAPVCPNCGAQGHPGATRCHSCGKDYLGSSSSRSVWWIAGLGAALILALIIGLGLACGSIFGGVGDLAREGIDASFEELERVQEQSSITQSDFVSVRPGTSRSAVEARLGRPADVSTRSAQTALPREPGGTSCIYYFEQGQSLFLGPTYRFCFARGGLAKKGIL